MESLLTDAHSWVAVSFVIFAVGAFLLGRKSILDKLDTRIGDIRKEIATAEGLRIEAQELLAQYQRKRRDAVREAESIIETAKEHAVKIKLQAEADLAEAVARREKTLAERLKRMEETAIQDIRAQAAELATTATMQAIAEKLDEKANAALIDQSVKGLSGQLN